MPFRKHTAFALTAAALLSAAPLAAPVNAQTAPPDSYIVVLNDGSSTDQIVKDQASRYRFTASHVYHTVLNGYSAPMSAAVAAKLRAEKSVAYVSPDLQVQAPNHPQFWDHAPAPVYSPFNTQKAPTGIRRVGASTNGVSQGLVNNGAGIGVAIIDTGIQLNHPDLGVVTSGTNCVNPAQPAADDYGHGTHVAGTVAARDNFFGVVGVAPQASLVAVKVLDSSGSGTWSDVICGIDWVTAHASTYNIRVANMSLGASGTITPSNASTCANGNMDALHTAVCNSVKAGITYTVAAGNSSANANSFVPGGYAEVISVSAWSDTNGKSDAAGPNFTCNGWGVQTDEHFATGTNWGPAVDIAAPGVGIRSTVLGSTYGTMCGTSMAAPHVAGAAALALAHYPSLTPSGVRTLLKSQASVLPHNAQHTENLLNVSLL